MSSQRDYRTRMKNRAILLGFYTALALLLFCYKYLDFVARENHVDWRVPLLEEFTGTYAALALLPAVLRVARRWPPRKGDLVRFLGVHLPAIAVFAFLHTTLMAVSRQVLFSLLGLGPYDYGNLHVRYWMEGSQDVVFYSVTVALVWLFDRYRASKDLEVELAQAQLRTLQLQLQPHFLFNALNTISSVMYEDVAAADAMISRLSEFLRLTLRATDTQEVRLKDELELLEAWLSILKVRFEDNLEVDISVDPAICDAFVPQLILQPLVENAIRHGADPATNRIAIQIDARRVNGTVQMKVRDHGPGLSGACPEGVGLANTRSRLTHLYGANQIFTLHNSADGGLGVTIVVPYSEAPARR